MINKLAQEWKGRLHGDEESGQIFLPMFLGSIEGDYSISGEILHLTITKKPFLVGCETIDATIRDYLATLV